MNGDGGVTLLSEALFCRKTLLVGGLFLSVHSAVGGTLLSEALFFGEDGGVTLLSLLW